MPFGPGKYDEICTYVREQINASGVLVIVLGGNKGSGFSCQADLMTTLQLPEVLESVAAAIRKERVAAACQAMEKANDAH